MKHDREHRRSYAEEIELAQRSAGERDRAHALHHCVAALAMEPHRREWRATLLELLEDRELVHKLEQETFFGSRAALAWYHHSRGDLTEALTAIAQVADVAPELGFHRWFAAWVADPGAVASAASVRRVLLLVTTFGVGRIRMLPAERAAAEELVPVAEYAMRAVDDHYVLWLASATFRRAGKYGQAVEAGAKARPKLPPDFGSISLGLALRANREFDLACKVFDEAYAATHSVDFLHEKLRVLADAGRWEDALSIATHIAKISELGQENLEEHAELRARLAKRAPAPDEPPLDIVRRRAVGHGMLASMVDATANGLRQFARREQESGKSPSELGALIRGDDARIAISGNEGASNRLCQALMFSGEPDPRRASYSNSTAAVLQTVTDRTDLYSLWRIDNGVVVQALPPPPAEVADWIEKLALQERDGALAEALDEPGADFLDMWSFGKRGPLLGSSARDWVAAMIYPRMPLFRVAMGPDWVYRWQVASLIGLARSETIWSGSQRRDAFLSLLDGAIDWPLAAAIRVIAEIALEEPETTAEIRARLIRLAETLGYVPNAGIPATLLNALEALPFVAEHHISALRSRLQAGDSGPEDSEQQDEPPPTPTTKRPWWKVWGR